MSNVSIPKWSDFSDVLAKLLTVDGAFQSQNGLILVRIQHTCRHYSIKFQSQNGLILVLSWPLITESDTLVSIPKWSDFSC